MNLERSRKNHIGKVAHRNAHSHDQFLSWKPNGEFNGYCENLFHDELFFTSAGIDKHSVEYGVIAITLSFFTCTDLRFFTQS